jgi:hypothetical protein
VRSCWHNPLSYDSASHHERPTIKNHGGTKGRRLFFFAFFLPPSLVLLATTPAIAQQTAPLEISGAFLALTAGSNGYPKGYLFDLVANVAPRLGVVVATDGAYRDESFDYVSIAGRGPSGTIIQRIPLTLKTTTRGVVAGARITWRDPRVLFFVQASAGAAHLSSRADISSSSESAASLRDAYGSSRWRPAVQAGVGANVAIGGRNAIRIGGDYRRVERVPRSFIESGNSGRGPNQFMFAVGYARMFGN